MNALMYRFLPMIISLALGQFIYIKIDEKYDVTNKISSKLHIKQKWKGLVCYCFILIVITIISVLQIYVIDVPDTVNSIIAGCFIGISVSITTKISNNKII